MPRRVNTGPQDEVRKRVVSEYQGKASVDDLLRKTGAGRPSVLSKSDKLTINSVRQNPFMTIREMAFVSYIMYERYNQEIS